MTRTALQYAEVLEELFDAIRNYQFQYKSFTDPDPIRMEKYRETIFDRFAELERMGG
jgi:hypothetical protein